MDEWKRSYCLRASSKERQAKNIYNAVNGCCNEVYLVRLLDRRV